MSQANRIDDGAEGRSSESVVLAGETENCRL